MISCSAWKGITGCVSTSWTNVATVNIAMSKKNLNGIVAVVFSKVESYWLMSFSLMTLGKRVVHEKKELDKK